MSVADGPVLAMSREEANSLLAKSTDQAHEGRVYDYYLGGSSNYAVDRLFARKQIERVPDLPWAARQNRKFLTRVVRHMVDLGIRQFVDMGSGLPTEGNVHEIAEEHAPGECRVVYVDHDAVASAHAYLLLERSGELERNAPVNGDLLAHERLWEAIVGTGLIDTSQPVGLLMVAVLHFLPDELDPHRSVAFYRDQLPSGSCLAISHASTDQMSDDARERLSSVLRDYDRTTSKALARTRPQVREFFGDWSLFDPPGIVWTPEWYAPGTVRDEVGDADPSRSQIIAGLARKP